MITCSNLSVSYGKKNILDHLNFSVKQGELAVIIGRNGSGKTTLFKALSNAVPYKGSILVQGTDVRSIHPSRRARLLSVMPQQLPTPELTVRDLVAFGRHPYTGFSGILSAADWEIVDETIAHLGLSQLSSSHVNQLSGGECRKAFFAMSLAQKAPLLLVDEPCANLDPEHCKYILSLLKARRDVGDTILCILHDVNHAFSIADRILALDCGKLVFDGTPEQAALSRLPETLFSLQRIEGTDEQREKVIVYQ